MSFAVKGKNGDSGGVKGSGGVALLGREGSFIHKR